jgi:predicted nucleic acid-binding protein
MVNGFQAAIRCKRIDTMFRDQALSELAPLPITVDPETTMHAWTSTLRLSDQFGLTPYDAAYLELAQRRRLPLATLDKALRSAARAAGTDTVGQP